MSKSKMYTDNYFFNHKSYYKCHFKLSSNSGFKVEFKQTLKF